jgi:hypothetical protein
MAGVGTLITAADYNSIQSAINLVMGTNATGYGQALASSQVTQGSVVSVTQWNNLRTDILKARQHQTGNNESASLTVPVNTLVISEATRSQYATVAATASTNSFSIGTLEGGVEAITSRQRTTTWNGTVTNTVTVTFGSALQARYFFNAGGQIRLSASRVNNPSDPDSSYPSSSSKITTWTNMLSGMGTIFINHTLTGTVAGASSPGTGTSIGFYDLTTSDQQIYNKPAPSGSYSLNSYVINARANLSSNPTEIIFTIQFKDDTSGGIDEPVPGILTSTAQQFRPQGSNVSVTGPTGTSTGM